MKDQIDVLQNPEDFSALLEAIRQADPNIKVGLAAIAAAKSRDHYV